MEKITIAQALNNIKYNKYVMPLFQRGFVWNMPQIEKLWDSILRGYPISNFLLWRIGDFNSSEDTNFCFFRNQVKFNNAKQPKVADFRVGTVSFENTDIAVLDGQQRFTALYLSLMGDVEILAKGAHSTSNGSVCSLVIELNKNKIETTDEEIISEENGKIKKDTYYMQYGISFTRKQSTLSRTQFEIKKLMSPEFQDEEYRKTEFDKIVEMVPNDSKEYARDTLNKLYAKIFVEPLIVCTTLENMHEDAALEVFVRFNSGGTRLSKSDISMSILASYWPNAQTRFREVLQGDYANFGPDFIIRTALMLYSNVLKSNISREMAVRLRDEWEHFKTALDKLKTLLNSFDINVNRFASGWNVLLPIIYVIYYNPDYEQNATGIKTYLFRAILFTYFQSGTTSKLSTLKNKLNEYDRVFETRWMDNDGDVRALAVTDAKIDDILNSQKKDRVAGEALFLLNRDWIKQINYDLDHLHPRTRFDELPPAGHEAEWSTWRQNRDKLPNLWPLKSSINRGDKSAMPLIDFYNSLLSEEEKVLFKEHAMLPTEFEEHVKVSDNVLLDFNHFGEFYDARKEVLKEKLRDLLNGK